MNTDTGILFRQRILHQDGLYHGSLDGADGALTQAAQLERDRLTDQYAEQCGHRDEQSEANIRTLLLRMQIEARNFLKLIHVGYPTTIEVRIISGTRTYAEQDALYAQGRDGHPGKIVTKARGGESNHNFGSAFDIGVFDSGVYLEESPRYANVAEQALVALPGLEWGGNWHSIQDKPHFQRSYGLTESEIRRRFEAGQPFWP